MTHDKKQPGLPVVEVDQAFPLMTTDAVSRSATSTGVLGDQGPDRQRRDPGRARLAASRPGH